MWVAGVTGSSMEYPKAPQLRAVNDGPFHFRHRASRLPSKWQKPSDESCFDQRPAAKQSAKVLAVLPKAAELSDARSSRDLGRVGRYTKRQ